MSDMAEEAPGVQESSPEAAAERPETCREGDDEKSAAGGEDEEDELPVRAGRLERASLAAGDAGVAGKRAKKSVERLDLQAPKHKEKLTIAQGSGDKLGDIPRTNLQIGKLKSEDLKPLHAILFERPGKMASVKKNLRLFNGFPFAADSDQYVKKRDKLLKNAHFTNTKLKLVCSVLDLEKKGTQSQLVDRIMTFLLEPKDSGKRLAVKKKKQSRKKASGDSAATGKKAEIAKSRRVSPSSSSPKKSKAPSKSQAIVMDSSTDEDQNHHDDDEAPAGQASDSEDKSTHKDDDEEEEEEEEEEYKPAAAKKRSRAPAKRTPPPRKRVKGDPSDDNSDSDQAKKKKKPPAAKTKKADSSSKNTNTDDTSDEDEPLIRMIKRAPSDDELKETLRALLVDADLAQMTMKHICQRVFDTYPEDDLSGRKDFIKQSVKALIT